MRYELDAERICMTWEQANELFELAFGDGAIDRYEIDEMIKKLREYTINAFAWDKMVDLHTPWRGNDTQHDWEMRELMDKIMDEVKQ